MQIAFVQDRQDHVHDEDRHQHQDREIGNRVAEGQSLTLQLALHPGRQQLLGRLSTNCVAGPMEYPGFRLKNIVTLVN